MTTSSSCMGRVRILTQRADITVFHHPGLNRPWNVRSHVDTLAEIRKCLNIRSVQRPYSEGVIVPLLLQLAHDMRKDMRQLFPA